MVINVFCPYGCPLSNCKDMVCEPAQCLWSGFMFCYICLVDCPLYTAPMQKQRRGALLKEYPYAGLNK